MAERALPAGGHGAAGQGTVAAGGLGTASASSDIGMAPADPAGQDSSSGEENHPFLWAQLDRPPPIADNPARERARPAADVLQPNQ